MCEFIECPYCGAGIRFSRVVTTRRAHKPRPAAADWLGLEFKVNEVAIDAREVSRALQRKLRLHKPLGYGPCEEGSCDPADCNCSGDK